MSEHGYESGRLNLPFVGICTFGKYRYVENWDDIKADVAVMGAPFDFGCQWRSGARMGPRSVREGCPTPQMIIDRLETFTEFSQSLEPDAWVRQL